MKKNITTKKFMVHFIIGYILYEVITGFIFSFFTEFITVLIKNNPNKEIISLIINILFFAITEYLSVIFSIKSIKKKYEYSNTGNCINNIIIFFVIAALLPALTSGNITYIIIAFIIHLIVLLTTIPYIKKQIGIDNSSQQDNFYSQQYNNYNTKNNKITLNKNVKTIFFIIFSLVFIIFVYMLIKEEIEFNNSNYPESNEINDKDNSNKKEEIKGNINNQTSNNNQQASNNNQQASNNNQQANNQQNNKQASNNNQQTKTLTCTYNTITLKDYKNNKYQEKLVIIATLKNNKCTKLEMVYTYNYKDKNVYLSEKNSYKNYSSNDVKFDDNNLIITLYIGNGHAAINGTEEWAKNKTETELRNNFKYNNLYGYSTCTIK